MKKKKSNTQIPQIIISLIILIFLVSSYWLVFTAKKVICTTNFNSDCPSKVTQLLSERIYGQPLLFIDLKTRLQTSIPNTETISVLTVKKQLPSTVLVTVELSKPVYKMFFNDQEFIVLESKEISSLSEKDVTQLPKIIIKHPTKTPVGHESDHQAIIKLFSTLPQLPITPTIVEWYSSDEIRIYTDKQIIGILDSSDPTVQLQKFATILQSRNLDSFEEPITEIDVRFELPIIHTKS